MPPRTPRELRVTAWIDPLLDETGFDARGEYVDIFWLPTIGPSATALLRHLAMWLAIAPDHCTFEMDELGRSLGLGTSESKHAPLPRAIARLVRFGLARRSASGQLSVRQVVGPISQHLVERLSEPLQDLHAEVLGQVLGRQSLRRETACDPAPPATAPSPTADQRAG
jgi:hypothetical protein